MSERSSRHARTRVWGQHRLRPRAACLGFKQVTSTPGPPFFGADGRSQTRTRQGRSSQDGCSISPVSSKPGSKAYSSALRTGRRAPFVERIWRCHSGRAGTFPLMAASHWEMMSAAQSPGVSQRARAKEQATTAGCPAEGSGLPSASSWALYPLPRQNLRDRRDVTLPEATQSSFWLDGSAWQYPDFNAGDLREEARACRVDRRRPSIDAVLQGHRQERSYVPRSAIF
jgi:hypothetical protein